MKIYLAILMLVMVRECAKVPKRKTQLRKLDGEGEDIEDQVEYEDNPEEYVEGGGEPDEYEDAPEGDYPEEEEDQLEPADEEYDDMGHPEEF